jgi:hypothetical protein
MSTLHINGKAVPATEFAYDGCHKIYLIFTPEQREELSGYGYGKDEGTAILPVSELPRVWAESCGLKFISAADLSTHYVSQFDEDEPSIDFKDDPQMSVCDY